MKLLREVAWVSVSGLLLTLLVGLVRGLPHVASATSASTGACMPPVPARPTVQWISLADAKRLFDADSAKFVDARSAEEYQGGHIPNALNVPMEDGVVPENVIQALRGSQSIVTYCDTSKECARSSRLAGILSSSGIASVHVLEGGFPAWMEHEYPAQAGM